MPTRVATLKARDTRMPGGLLVAVGPFLILGMVALYLRSHWDLIPDRFATKWSTDGTPIRWATKTVGSVYGVLVMGVVIVAATRLQTSALLRRTRQIAATGSAADAEWRFKRRNALAGVIATYTMAVLFSYFATRKVTASDNRMGSGIWLLLGVIVAFAGIFTTWMAIAGQGGQRQVPPAERALGQGDATPDAAWKAGLLYYNPSDPAVFVEKRMGVGWTVNFGNPWTWVFLAAVVLVPLLIAQLLKGA